MAIPYRISGPNRISGLTLLEMIVVLRISGMALALGFQALVQWQRAQASIGAVGGQLREVTLTQDWLRDSLRGLTPVKEAPFAGDDLALSGITLTPVTAGQGGSATIAWRIESGPRGLELSLEENGQAMQLPLPDSVSAHFSYLDEEGTSHRQWPPALGTGQHLPAAIVLTQERTEPLPSRVWVASIAGIREPIQTFYDIEDF